MPPPIEIRTLAESMGPVALAWTACALGLLVLPGLARLLGLGDGRRRGAPLRAIARGEDGAAYTLSYVLVIPFYLFLIAAIVETSQVLIAKLGTVQAAYVGARTAIVRLSSDGPGKSDELVRRAAVRGMAPFASARRAVFGPQVPSTAGEDVEAYLAAYRRYAKRPASSRYVRAKYLYAKEATRVEVRTGPDDRPDFAGPDVTVTVRYDFPFTFPGIGRLLGQKKGAGLWVYPVVSRVTLAEESPRNRLHSLGISYASPK